MKHFHDKVAVITGGASGIGRALAECCAQNGMRIVLADVEEKALFQAEEDMKAGGARVLAVPTDVSKERHMERLARKTLEAYGKVHLLFNNAGVVGAVTAIWKSSVPDWNWVLGVNLWGVIYGMRVFVPPMLEQDEACHIVNTSSMGALIYGPGGIYGVSKHAVVGLSETLYRELVQRNSKIRVSLFCPGFVNTRIMESDRNCPFKRTDDPAEKARSGEDRKREQSRSRVVEAGISPLEAANRVFDGIREDRFYILTDPDVKTLIADRMETILREGNPRISYP